MYMYIVFFHFLLFLYSFLPPLPFFPSLLPPPPPPPPPSPFLSLSSSLLSSPLSQVELLLYFCESSGVCHMQGVILNIPLRPSDSAPNPALATLHFAPELPNTS